MKPDGVAAQNMPFSSPPHGGVWIETNTTSCQSANTPCHPLTGGCGLKHARIRMIPVPDESPPHGGVWIETRIRWKLDRLTARHPLTGGCGLKHKCRFSHVMNVCHPLTGGGGLRLERAPRCVLLLRRLPCTGFLIGGNRHGQGDSENQSEPIRADNCLVQTPPPILKPVNFSTCLATRSPRAVALIIHAPLAPTRPVRSPQPKSLGIPLDSSACARPTNKLCLSVETGPLSFRVQRWLKNRQGLTDRAMLCKTAHR